MIRQQYVALKMAYWLTSGNQGRVYYTKGTRIYSLPTHSTANSVYNVLKEAFHPESVKLYEAKSLVFRGWWRVRISISNDKI